MKINYDLKLQEELKKIGDTKPSLLLHVCCGPVSYTHLDVYKRQPWDELTGETIMNAIENKDSLKDILLKEADICPV